MLRCHGNMQADDNEEITSLPSPSVFQTHFVFVCPETPEYKQRIVQEPPVEREVMRWSSHSEAMLQAALDDVDWDMFRASSSDVSKFMDVALSFVNTLTEQATENGNNKDILKSKTVGGQINP